MFNFNKKLWQRIRSLEEHFGIVFDNNPDYSGHVNTENSDIVSIEKRLKVIEDKLNMPKKLWKMK